MEIHHFIIAIICQDLMLVFSPQESKLTGQSGVAKRKTTHMVAISFFVDFML